MIAKEVTVLSKKGIHARPASRIVQAASKFNATIHIVRDDDVVNAKSIIGILTLGAVHKSKLTIKINGDDEHAAMSKMIELFEKVLI